MIGRAPSDTPPDQESPLTSETQISPDRLETMEEIGENAYRTLADLGIPLDHPFVVAVLEFGELSKRRHREKQQQSCPKT